MEKKKCPKSRLEYQSLLKTVFKESKPESTISPILGRLFKFILQSCCSLHGGNQNHFLILELCSDLPRRLAMLLSCVRFLDTWLRQVIQQWLLYQIWQLLNSGLKSQEQDNFKTLLAPSTKYFNFL